MIIIPGQAIAILTFPGIVVHEMAHKFFADLAGVPVYEVCYLRAESPQGYVLHDQPNDLKSAFLISYGPIFLNTFLCVLITFIPVMLYSVISSRDYSFVSFVLHWVGLSIGMHAFPSNQDASSFVEQVKRQKGRGVLWGISWILAGILMVANVLRFFWLDAVYAVCVSRILLWKLGFLPSFF